MQTVTIDILNTQAMRLIEDLESLQLIHVRKGKDSDGQAIDWKSKYKGKLSKEPIEGIDKQLKELRNGWE